MEGADASQIVIAAPQFAGEIKGKEDPDDFQDPRFNGPISTQWGVLPQWKKRFQWRSITLPLIPSKGRPLYEVADTWNLDDATFPMVAINRSPAVGEKKIFVSVGGYTLT